MEKELKKTNNMKSFPVGKSFWCPKMFKLIVKQAIPGILSAMLFAVVPLIDNLYAGFLGDDVIAAVNYSISLQLLFLAIVFGLQGACTVIFAQYYGSNEDEKVKSAHKLKMVLIVIFWLFSLIPLVILPGPILYLFTSNHRIVHLATRYTRIIGIGLIIYWIAQGYISSLLQMGYSFFVLSVTLVPIIINSIFDYLLAIYYNFNVEGLAYATILSNFISIIVFEIFINSKKLIIKFNWFLLFSFDKSVLKKIIKRWHMIIVEFSFGLGIIIISIIIARAYDNYKGQTYGVINGVYGIFTKLASASIVGFYGSVAYFCGKYLGAGLYDEAYTNAKRIYLVSFIFGITFSGIFAIFAPYYVNAFFPNISEANRVQTIMILRLYVFIFPAFILGILSFRILEAGGQTKIVMIFDFVHTWVVLVILGYLIFYVWNPEQYWKAWVVASFCRYTRAIVATMLVKHKLWLVNLLETEAIEPRGLSYAILAISTIGLYPLVSYIKTNKKNKD